MVLTPQGSVTPVGFVPRYRRFTVVGIFHASSGFSFDSSYAFINISDAQKLYLMGTGVTGLRLKIDNPLTAPAFSLRLQPQLPATAQVDDWTEP